MSHVEHHIIAVTSWEPPILKECRTKLIDLSVSVTAIYLSQVNGYGTFFVYPSGSKEGWAEGRKHTESIAAAKEVLESYRYEDGSSPIEYLISNYSDMGREV